MITKIYRVGITIPDHIGNEVSRLSLETAFDSMFLKATKGSINAETCNYDCGIDVMAEYCTLEEAQEGEKRLKQMVEELVLLIQSA